MIIPCCSSSGSAIPVRATPATGTVPVSCRVEALARRHGIGPRRRRFQGVSAEGPLGGERALLLLPGTYMNDSGRAVAEAAHFYKLGLSDIVVVHDEIDLAPGKMRVKTGGGV